MPVANARSSIADRSPGPRIATSNVRPRPAPVTAMPIAWRLLAEPLYGGVALAARVPEHLDVEAVDRDRRLEDDDAVIANCVRDARGHGADQIARGDQRCDGEEVRRAKHDVAPQAVVLEREI